MQSSSIILMGIKHCGKSTQARLLSRHYSVPSFDTDDLITEITGKTPREIYSSEGKEAFMKAEAKACQYLKEKIDALPETGIKAVIATGGGICNNQAAVDILKSAGILVFLNSDEETAVSRIIREIKIESNGSLSNLPAYIAVENPKSLNDVRISFHKFYVARQSIYNSLCNVTVDMKPVTKSENRDAIIDALARCK